MLINRLLSSPDLNPCSDPQPSECIRITNILVIAAIILISAISIGIRAYHTTPTGDDIIYSYILGPETQANAPIIGEINSITDAVQSQVNQYFHHNGRFLVHILLQSICGLSPQMGFGILSGILTATVVILLVVYTIPATQRTNPIYWIIASGALLYLFPEHSTLWLSRALCCNYLYPMALVLLWLVLYRHWQSGVNSWRLWLLSLLGFCTGFSHECFALTLSGALFVISVMHFKSFFTKKSIPIICLWIGTILVVASPGNFQRQGSILSHFINFLHLVPHLTIIVASLLAAIVAFITRKKTFFDTSAQKYVILWALLFAILFGAIANSGLWSLTDIEFYASILLISYIYCIINTWGHNSRTLTALIALCTIVFGIHQTAIIRAQIKQYDAEQAAIKSFIYSPMGLAYYTPPRHAPYIGTFVSPMTLAGWTSFSLSVKYADGKKPCIIVGPDDMRIMCGDSTIFQLLIPGSASLYKGNYNLWARNTKNQFVDITLQRLPNPVIDIFRPKDANQTFIWKAGPMKHIQYSDSTLSYIFPYSTHHIISADKITY